MVKSAEAPPKSVTLSLRMDARVYNALVKASADDGRPKSQFVVRILTTELTAKGYLKAAGKR